MRELYHFKAPDDIVHLLADACVMTAIVKRNTGISSLMKLSHFLTTFNTDLERFRYTVMPFGATVAGDVFQCKLDQCFGHIRNVIVIADDIMIVGKKQNHSDHDQALTTLLETARRCNVRLNYDKLNISRMKSIS